ncbi:hypothetical protein Barb7_02176 [Bacteroidales bacterium Barb7]|nr:hypothetical protein Barb7_02176 [Bacteroidales bacterium Barb7]
MTGKHVYMMLVNIFRVRQQFVKRPGGSESVCLCHAAADPFVGINDVCRRGQIGIDSHAAIEA